MRWNLHSLVDVAGQRNMWRYRWPPVESTPAELERLLAIPEEDLHPPVAPAEFTWRERRLPMRPAFASEAAASAERARRTGAAGDLDEDHFTFPSPRPCRDELVDTVHCVRWRPAGRTGSETALVVAHGAFAETHGRTLMYMPEPARAAWDTVAIELPHHMRRRSARSEFSGQYLVSADVPRLIRGMHQAEADIRALVGGLRTLGYARVVLGGVSLGGNAVLEALVRQEADGAFAIVPAVDAYASLWESVLGRCFRRAGNAAGIADEAARRALRLITPVHMGRPAIPAGRLLLVYGTEDLLCPAEPVRLLGNRWGGCRERALRAGHATMILMRGKVRRIVAGWMGALARA